MACVAVADRGPVALELRWVRIPEPRNHRSFECLLSIFGGTTRSLTSELMMLVGALKKQKGSWPVCGFGSRFPIFLDG